MILRHSPFQRGSSSPSTTGLPELAREIDRWFDLVYHNPEFTTSAGVWGTAEQVKEQLFELITIGANHLVLNPVSNYHEQLEQVAELVGFRADPPQHIADRPLQP